VQVGDTRLWSKDVQRLLWAAGEARARVPRRKRKRQVTRPQESAVIPAEGEFFTEWQPITGHPS
jgi:hypothetical protein